MAAMVASSPVHCQAAAFKSPLRNFRAEACKRAASDEVYADAHSNVAQWRKDLVSSAGYQAQQGLRELQNDVQQLKGVKEDLHNVKSLVQVATQLHAGGARLAQVLQSSADAGALRAQAVAHINDDLHETVQRRQHELDQEERSIAQQKVVADAQHAEALKMLAVYQDRLGLVITREASQTVRMSFSLIDESDPAREFWFTLGLQESDGSNQESYCICECEPQVPEMEHLLAELNQGACSATALSRFACSVRRAFSKLAKAEQH